MTRQAKRELLIGIFAPIVAIATAVLLNFVLGPNLARDSGLLLTSVLLAAWWGNQRGAVIATFLCFTGLATFIASRDAVSFSFRQSDVWQLLSFVVVSATLNLVNAARYGAERRLRVQEERFSLFMQNFPGAAWIKDVHGRYVYANDEALRIFRVDRDELYGRSDDQVFETPFAEKLKTNDRTAIAYGETIQTLEELSADGDPSLSIVAKFPVLGLTGRPAFVGGIALDITERTRAEAALERERELLERVFETIPVMIVMHDPATAVQRVNGEFTKVTGWTTEAANAVDLWEESYPDPKDRDEVRRVIETGSPEWRDITMTTRDGRKVDTTWANISLSDQTQIAIGLDITARKNAEIELQNLVRELEVANNAKDEFLSMVSHELRTPLTVIMGYANYLSRRGETMSASERQDAHLEVRRESERLSRIVENLLVLARLDRGQAVDIDLLMLPRLLRAQADEFDRWHPDRKVSLAEVEELPLVEGCQVYVEQVVKNLMANADKYSPPEELIELEACSTGREVIISVLDRGPGIAPEDREKIFEPFYRAETSETKLVQGFGIGLSACRRLVASMGGRIWMEPRDGGGSAFRFSLPADESNFEAAPETFIEDDARQPVA